MPLKGLGIVSDCIHFYTPNGCVATETHIFLHQIEALSAYFSEVTITCPFSNYKPESVYTTYRLPHIHFIPLPVTGGGTIKDKMAIIATFPKWFRAYRQLNKTTDIIYMRLPDNVSLPAFFYFLYKRKKTFITYTGTWDNYKGEAATWRLEKWLLRNICRGPFWVYTNKQLIKPTMHKGFSPSYTRRFWHQQTALVEKKKEDFAEGKNHLRFITVGAWVPHKNQLAVIEACRILQSKGYRFTLTIVGDGVLRNLYAQKIKDLELEKEVILAGRKTREELAILFAENDFVVQMPYQEPYGKVPVEGLFFGLLPVLSDVGISATFTGSGAHGFLCAPDDISRLSDILSSLYTNQKRLVNMINKGRSFVYHNTLENWAEHYYQVISSLYQAAH